MKIPVFVSHPTDTSPDQKARHRIIQDELDTLQLEPRTLGQSDYPTEYPLSEVYSIARHCAGGIVLGFSQLHVDKGTIKKGSKSEKEIQDEIILPTPWNNLEAGIMFSLGLPMIVFKEPGIAGGIFDLGTSYLFIQNFPSDEPEEKEKESLREVFLKWSAKVRDHYYRTPANLDG